MCLRCHARAERARKRRIAAELKELRRAKYFGTAVETIDTIQTAHPLRKGLVTIIRPDDTREIIKVAKVQMFKDGRLPKITATRGGPPDVTYETNRLGKRKLRRKVASL